MATHSSILAWKIPWIEETGRLQAHGVTKSQTRLSMHAYQVQLSKFRNLSRKLFWRKLPRVERTDSTFHSDFLLLWDLFQSSKHLML